MILQFGKFRGYDISDPEVTYGYTLSGVNIRRLKATAFS
jgi:hypothetical protein